VIKWLDVKKKDKTRVKCVLAVGNTSHLTYLPIVNMPTNRTMKSPTNLTAIAPKK
jgi:hypothetical protein